VGKGFLLEYALAGTLAERLAEMWATKMEL
jgi:hypothetical protein